MPDFYIELKPFHYQEDSRNIKLLESKMCFLELSEES